RRVRMLRMLGSDAPEPVEPVVLARVAVPELVEVRVVESQRAARAVHLDAEVTWTTRANATHLEGAARSVDERREAGRRFVNLDEPPATLARERLRLRCNLVDLSHDPEREVDQVRAEVGDRRSAHRPLERPVDG